MELSKSLISDLLVLVPAYTYLSILHCTAAASS